MDLFIPTKGTELQLEEDWEFSVEPGLRVPNHTIFKAYGLGEEGDGFLSFTIPEGTWIKFKDVELKRSEMKEDKVKFRVQEPPSEYDQIQGKDFKVNLGFFNQIKYEDLRGSIPQIHKEKFNYCTVREKILHGNRRRLTVHRLQENLEEARDDLYRDGDSVQIWKLKGLGGYPSKGDRFSDSHKEKHEVVEDYSDTPMGGGPYSSLTRSKGRFRRWVKNVPKVFRFLQDEVDSLYVLKDEGREDAKPFVAFKKDGTWTLRIHPLLWEIGDWKNKDRTFDRLKDAVSAADSFIVNNWEEYEAIAAREFKKADSYDRDEDSDLF